MCIATVYVDTNGDLKEAMRDVVYIEVENGRFQLVNLLGEEKYLEGKLKRIDFWEEHSVVIEQGR
ncbi:MAG: CooT family nickel-binding protein [Dehalococcoidia bacterium]|nr:CooT family nickel-binding protein [Dehalococcoidia bacterium]